MSDGWNDPTLQEKIATGRINEQWYFALSCEPNDYYTSRASQILDEARNRGESIKIVDTFSGSRGIDIVLFKRFRVVKGRKIDTDEFYFATRANEYRGVILTLDEAKSKPAERTNWLRSFATQCTLDAEATPAISEEKFQMRVTLLSLLGGFLFFALMGFALVILLKKRSRR